MEWDVEHEASDALAADAIAADELNASLRRDAAFIVGVYTATASLWIVASDPLIAAIAGDGESMVWLSVAKGLTFVAATAALLHILLRRTFSAVVHAFDALQIERRKRVRHERQHRTKLAELNANLERSVEERTAELNDARKRAEAADDLKSAFLATMSHELRTPLNSIIGFTGILRQELAGPINPEQRKQLGMVQRSSRHLLDLINDVLDISKIEAGQLEVAREPCDLHAMIDALVSSLEPQATEKGVALQLVTEDRLPLILTDRRRTTQILLNLINNAIKFTGDGAVTVTVGKTPDARRASIRVADTGIGIAPEDLEVLFQPFQQIDGGLQRQHDGTGLGLAIARRLAHLLDGSISVESELGTGSAFTLELPLTSRSSE